MKKTLGIAAIGGVLASQAAAHGGAHLHPHGAEISLAAVLVLAAAGVAFLAWVRK